MEALPRKEGMQCTEVKSKGRSRPEGKCGMVRRRHPVTRLVADSPRGPLVRGGFRLWGKPTHQPMRPLGNRRPCAEDCELIIETNWRLTVIALPENVGVLLHRGPVERAILGLVRPVLRVQQRVDGAAPLLRSEVGGGGRTWPVAEVGPVSPPGSSATTAPLTVAAVLS